MTEEQLQQLEERPKEFLRRCQYHEQRIKEKLELKQHYRDLAEQITAEIKEVTTFNLCPANKIENCAIELTLIDEDIQREVKALREDMAVVHEAIDFLDDESPGKILLEAKYLNGKNWEEIAGILDISYRWTLRLHGLALQKLQERAKEKKVEKFSPKPC